MKKQKNRRWLFLLVLIAAMFALIIQLSFLNINTRAAVAERGKVTITEESIRDGFLLLDGQLLVHDNFHPLDITETSEWQYSCNLRSDIHMENHTYSMLLTVDDVDLCFLMPQPKNCVVWINGIKLTEEQLLPGRIIQLSDFAIDDNNHIYRIFLQVGESTSLRVRYHGFIFGTQEQLTKVLLVWNSSTMIAVGICLLLLVQIFALFAQKRSERYLLLLMLVVLQAGLRGLHISLYPSHYIFYSGSKFDVFMEPLFRLTLPFNLLLLITLFPKDIGKKTLICGLIISGLGLACAFAQIMGFNVIRQSTFVEWAMLFLEAGCIIKSFLLERPGSRVLLAGVALNFAGRIFARLIIWGVVPTGIVDTYYYPWQYANLIYLISFVIAIDGKFARKFQEADILSENLQQINADLERIVADRTTNLEKSNRELAQKNEMLIKLQQDKQKFLGNIVHNLRTPLFTLGGSVEMLQEETKDYPQFSSRLHRMKDKVDYIQNMINELFLIVRMDDGLISFDIKKHDLKNLLLQCCADFQQKAERKGVEIQTILPENPVLIAFDDFYLRQAVENVLANAIRHSYSGKAVTVSLEQDQHSVHIRIQNFGAQISPEDLPHIFQRYYKGRDSKPEQAGLGLAITQEIISRHSGDITVNSNTESTCFTLTLPTE